MKVFSLLEFVIQSIVATMGAFVLGAIGARLLSIVVGLLTRNSGPVNVVDYPVDQQVFRGWLTVRIFWLPSLPPSCLASSRIAYGKRMRVSRFGCFRLCFWSGTYFRGNAPFYTSVAYSVGSIAMRVLGAARWSMGLGAMARRK
jgi:hypothetical protein